MSEALNQPPPLADYNLFLNDRALCGAVASEDCAPRFEASGGDLASKGGRLENRLAGVRRKLAG